MSKPTKKFVLILTSVILILVTIIILAFYPFLNLKYTVFKDSAGTQQNEVVITKFDLFKPKLSVIKKLGDGSYWVIISDYEIHT
jgi:hypothetical protein